MTHMFRGGCLVGVAALLAPHIALADITAADVWQNQQDVVSAVGGELSGQMSRSGDTETISDVAVAFELPFDAGSVSISGIDLTLTETGDGSVSMAYVEPIVLTLTADIKDEGKFAARIEIATEGMTATATGDPGDITTTYSVDQMALKFLDASGDIPDLDPDAISMVGLFVDMSGQTRVQVAEQVMIDGSYTLGAQNFEYAFKDPTGGTTSGTGTAEITEANSKIVLPRGGMDIMNLAAALADGLQLSVTSSITGYGTTQTVMMGGQVMSDQTSTTALQEVSYVFDEDGLKMDALAQDSALEFLMPQVFPAPLSASIANAGGTMQMPVSAGEAPQDAQVSMTLEGVTIAEGLWSMFDPGQVLSRAPAKVELDISGQVRNFVDWLNFAQVETVINAGDMPAEPVAMTLNKLDIELAGAQLSGTGAVTFDNGDKETYGGMPKPVGSFDLALNGANMLIDNLVSMGLVQDQDAMGARMMMGVMAKPDPSGAEDALVSNIELTEDGQILANGQRLK